MCDANQPTEQNVQIFPFEKCTHIHHIIQSYSYLFHCEAKRSNRTNERTNERKVDGIQTVTEHTKYEIFEKRSIWLYNLFFIARVWDERQLFVFGGIIRQCITRDVCFVCARLRVHAVIVWHGDSPDCKMSPDCVNYWKMKINAKRRNLQCSLVIYNKCIESHTISCCQNCELLLPEIVTIFPHTPIKMDPFAKL